MELETKLYKTCVDPALEALEMTTLRHLYHLPYEMKKAVKIMCMDLRFFKMFFWVLAYQGESSEHERRLRCVLSSMNLKFRQAAEEFKMQFECSASVEEVINWEGKTYHLSKRMNTYKPLVKEICILLLDGGFKCDSCQFEELFLEYGRETASLIDAIVENLQYLEWNIDLLPPLKQQFVFIKSFIESKLEIFGKFAYVAKDSPTKIGELIFHIQVWANHISCLTCLYWIHETAKSPASGEKTMLFDLMQRFMVYTPGILALYLDALKSIGYYKYRDEMVPQLPTSSLENIFENLVIPSKNDIETFGEGLIFLLSFVTDASKEDTEEREIILADIYAFINDVQSVICGPEAETKLSALLPKIDGVKQKERRLYVPTLFSSLINSPITNAIGFLDSVILDIKKMLEGKTVFTCFVKHNVEIIYQLLGLIRPCFQNILEMQNERNIFKQGWTQMINVVYYAAYVTKLCPVTSRSVWYGMICLQEVIEQLKLVMFDVQKIQGNQMYSSKMLTTETVCSNALLPRATRSTKGEAFTGFKQDLEEIINCLIRGQKDLRIISISGMAGQGKTTLAKRVYSDKLIEHHFDKMGWSYVSKECNLRELLTNIVIEVVGHVDGKPEVDDLVDLLRKCLKGKRYFIVLDDIWDVDVWRKMKLSFPNDKQGSRILFTSRNHNLASEAQPNSISYPLRPFSNEESWELMTDMLFNHYNFPAEFLEIGKKITAYCKGLPLAVTLIASHLRRTAQVLDLWEQVAGNLKSCLASEGCMDIIDLSYKYLPDHLKPCFLYFVAFPRGKAVCAKELKALWIAEGFVKENGTQCLQDLAENYLHHLVSQNLVVVTERSCRGGVKSCKVHHDLLYDLCLGKAVQYNFLHLANKNIVYNSGRYDFQLRLCLNENGPFTLPKYTNTSRELPTSQIHTLLFDVYSKEHGFLSSFLSNFTLVTVLDLQNIELYMFPKVLLYNIHLRYLNLGGWIKDIPPWIVDFWNLETLIVRSNYTVWSPNTLWEMKSLKYVDIRFGCNFYPESNMAGAGNIETLGGIYLPFSPMIEKFLKSNIRLRNLKCRRHKSESHPMWFSMFASLEMLESLTVAYDREWSPPNQQLPMPNFPNNLNKLVLKYSLLPWSAMSTVGKLPNLEVLKLLDKACVGPTWHLGDGEFSTLKYLKLYNLDVERIDDSGCDDYPFPCLEKLFLNNCKTLEEIPSSFGNICTLDTFDVFLSPQLSNSVRQIAEEQRDMGNNNFQMLDLCFLMRWRRIVR